MDRSSIHGCGERSARLRGRGGGRVDGGRGEREEQGSGEVGRISILRGIGAGLEEDAKHECFKVWNRTGVFLKKKPCCPAIVFRCCWPSLGTVGQSLTVLGGDWEEGPSVPTEPSSAEVLRGAEEGWERAPESWILPGGGRKGSVAVFGRAKKTGC